MTARSEDLPVRALSGGKPASLAGQIAWVLYEAAQGPYFVTITIVLYAPFFASTLVGDPAKGQAVWGYFQSAAGALVALASPFLGAFADAVGPRKPGLFLAMLVGAAGMALLWFAVPGEAHAVMLAGFLIMMCAVSMEFASVFHNAMLPSIVSTRRVGTLSGTGYAVSYIGAIGTLLLWQIFFNMPETSVFGPAPANHESERSIGPLVAAWTILFTLPLIALTPDQRPTGRRIVPAMRESVANLLRTFGHLRHYRNVAIYLLARTIYFDGLIVTYAFTGIYARGVFGWSLEQLTIYGAIVLIMSAVSGMAGGFIDNRIGSKRTIMIAVGLFAFGLILILGNTPQSVLYVPVGPDASPLPVLGPAWSGLGFTTLPEQVFLTLGFSIGVFGGPALASSRTMMARIAPPTMAAQFFGLYTFTGKATSFSGPLAVALITDWTGSQRLGLTVILLYLLIGGAGMLFVREEQAGDLPPENAASR